MTFNLTRLLFLANRDITYAQVTADAWLRPEHTPA